MDIFVFSCVCDYLAGVDYLLGREFYVQNATCISIVLRHAAKAC